MRSSSSTVSLVWVSALLAGFAASIDLVVVSPDAARQSALLALVESNTEVYVTNLAGVSGFLTDQMGLGDRNGKAIVGQRLPRASLFLVVGGLSPQIIDEFKLGRLADILSARSSSTIRSIQEPKEFDSMLQMAFQPGLDILADHEMQTKRMTISSSGFVCNLMGPCSIANSKISSLVSAISGNLSEDNQLSFRSSTGDSFQLDLSNDVNMKFLNEVSSMLGLQYPSLSVETPPIANFLVISSLEAVQIKFGVSSSEATACYHVLDRIIPKFFDEFQFPADDSMKALLLLPPSNAAFLTEAIRSELTQITGVEDVASRIHLPDISPDDLTVLQSDLSSKLPAHFQVLAVDPKPPANTPTSTDADPGLYQITLWSSVLFSILVLMSVCMLCCAEIRQDTLLYSKFNPTLDKKTR